MKYCKSTQRRICFTLTWSELLTVLANRRPEDGDMVSQIWSRGFLPSSHPIASIHVSIGQGQFGITWYVENCALDLDCRVMEKGEEGSG